MITIILLKFFLVFIFSFLFGINRQLSNKPIGFGTFIFVAIGSCMLGIITEILSPENKILVIGGVVTGIGFLGAGALIRTSDKIFGFTTAASIWIFSIIGLSIGFGIYEVGIIAYLTVWVVIIIDRSLEVRGIGSYQRKITIKTNKVVQKEDIIPLFNKYKWKLLNFEIDKKKKRSVLCYLVSGPRNFVNNLKDNFVGQSWLESFKIE